MSDSDLQHLDELLRAVVELEVEDPATRRAMARCLGIKAGFLAPPLDPGEARESERSDASPRPSSEESPVRRETEALPPPVDPAELRPPSRIEQVSPPERRLPDWYEQVAAFDTSPAPVVTEVPGWEPILRPADGPDLLLFSVRTQVDEGPLHVERLVERLARLETVEELPRRPRSTVRHGVQVLVDRSPSMQPFRRDQEELVDGLTRLLGPHRTEVYPFQVHPLQRRHGRRRGRRARAYAVPGRGTPVLLLSDLGLGRGRTVETHEWERFLDLTDAVQSPVVALVPCPEARWPEVLERRMTLLYWREGLLPQEVLTRLGRGHRVEDR